MPLCEFNITFLPPPETVEDRCFDGELGGLVLTVDSEGVKTFVFDGNAADFLFCATFFSISNRQERRLIGSSRMKH